MLRAHLAVLPEVDLGIDDQHGFLLAAQLTSTCLPRVERVAPKLPPKWLGPKSLTMIVVETHSTSTRPTEKPRLPVTSSVTPWRIFDSREG